MFELKEFLTKYKDLPEGKYYSTCPLCSPYRKKKHIKCLKIVVDDRGCMCKCYHCGEIGWNNED